MHELNPPDSDIDPLVTSQSGVCCKRTSVSDPAVKLHSLYGCRLVLRTPYACSPAIDGSFVVVCPLQPSSSVNSCCPGPENSILVSYRSACPICSQVTDHWGELCNRTGEVHPVDPFHSLDILKNHFASVVFCRNSGVYNVQNGAVIELSFVVSVKGSPRH